MLAVRDTTAAILTYALWALAPSRAAGPGRCRGPRARGSPTDPRRHPPSWGYTVQVLHEPLRLCPPAPALSRMAVPHIEVDGHRAKAGTMALVGIDAMHHGSTSPKTWIAGNIRLFAGGPRSCLGDHFASARSHLTTSANSTVTCSLPVCPTPRSATPLAAELGLYAQLCAARPTNQARRGHGIASAHATCPSKPSVLAMSRW